MQGCDDVGDGFSIPEAIELSREMQKIGGVSSTVLRGSGGRSGAEVCKDNIRMTGLSVFAAFTLVSENSSQLS